MQEEAVRVSPEPEVGTGERSNRFQVPDIVGENEGVELAGALGRKSNQRIHVMVTADNGIQGHDVGRFDLGSQVDEIAMMVVGSIDITLTRRLLLGRV